eukprot:7380297-Prymnesium_polylepis.4
MATSLPVSRWRARITSHCPRPITSSSSYALAAEGGLSASRTACRRSLTPRRSILSSFIRSSDPTTSSLSTSSHVAKPDLMMVGSIPSSDARSSTTNSCHSTARASRSFVSAALTSARCSRTRPTASMAASTARASAASDTSEECLRATAACRIRIAAR